MARNIDEQAVIWAKLLFDIAQRGFDREFCRLFAKKRSDHITGFLRSFFGYDGVILARNRLPVQRVLKCIDADHKSALLRLGECNAIGFDMLGKRIAGRDTPAFVLDVFRIERGCRFDADDGLHDDEGVIDFIFILVAALQLDTPHIVARDAGIWQSVVPKFDSDLFQQRLRNVIGIIGILESRHLVGGATGQQQCAQHGEEAKHGLDHHWIFSVEFIGTAAAPGNGCGTVMDTVRENMASPASRLTRS